MEKWEEGFYITAMAGRASGSSLVVMSKGTTYTQQSYKVSDSFPFKGINKKWKEGFYVTSMATSRTRWAVVMSRNAGFIDQCVELDFQYPSEGIHRRWDAGEDSCSLYSLRNIDGCTPCHPTRSACCHVLCHGSGFPDSFWIASRFPDHFLRRDARPGGLRAQRAAETAAGRDTGDAADVRVPFDARQGQVGEELVHCWCGVRSDGLLTRRCALFQAGVLLRRFSHPSVRDGVHLSPDSLVGEALHDLGPPAKAQAHKNTFSTAGRAIPDTKQLLQLLERS